jgi:hypothetical protein
VRASLCSQFVGNFDSYFHFSILVQKPQLLSQAISFHYTPAGRDSGPSGAGLPISRSQRRGQGSRKCRDRKWQLLWEQDPLNHTGLC